MFSRRYKIFAAFLVALFIFSGFFAFEVGPTNSSSSITASPSISWSHQVDVFIHNNLSAPTPSTFNEMIVVNSSEYSSYENANLSNVFFSNVHGQIIPSWLQSGNSNSYNNTTYWVRLNSSIQAHSTYVIYMDFGPTAGINFGPYTGEAPQLSKIYGQYDDGANVFNFYDNFSGTGLNTTLWKASNSADLQVNDGITFLHPSAIISLSQYSSSGISEAFGIMNTPTVSGKTGYDLGGIGFGRNGMNGSSPVMTMGWAENNTNSLGLTVYNSQSNPYTYNISKSISPNVYHVFGTGFINNYYTTGMIDNSIVNSSKVWLDIPPGTKLNVTLGFQSNNFPSNNHFYWVLEANTTPEGVNLPSQVGGYTVTFAETGIPSGDLWGFNIQNLTGMLGIGGYNLNPTGSVILPNGQFNYTLYSGTAGYTAANSTGILTVNGAPLTENVKFIVTTYKASLVESGLPAGTTWSVQISGEKFTSNGSMLNASLANGTYWVRLQSSNGYEPYPTSDVISINGKNTGPELIQFESPHNQSYLRSVRTINPITRTLYSGYNLSNSPSIYSSTVAVDQRDGLLFTAGDSHSGNITVMNTTTGTFVQNLSMGTGTLPYAMYYDSHNGYLYVTLDNGNVSIVNPNTMSVLKTIPVPQLIYSYIFALPSETSGNIYVYGGNDTNLTNATVYTLEPNGNIISEVNLSNINPFYIPYGPSINLAPPIYHQLLIAPSGKGLVVANVTTGVEKFVAAPAGFSPVDAVPYGSAGTYIVGNSNGNSDMTFNVQTLSWGSGPNLNGTVMGYAYDSLTNTYYYSSYSLTSGTGNITAVDPTTGTILATAPSIIPSDSIAFSQQSQSIYALDVQSFLSSALIHEYSVKHAYYVTFGETGLPSGVSWYDNITGQSSSGTISSGSNYVTILSNGTYSFSYSTSDPQYQGSAGKFTVSGSKITVSVSFKPVLFNVSFLAKGLAPGVEWYLNMSDGMSLHSTTQWINVSLMNGTYSYTIASSSSSYTAKGGNLTVKGTETAPFAVNFTKSQSKAPPLSNNILIIGGGSAGVVIAIGLIIYYLRRKPV